MTVLTWREKRKLFIFSIIFGSVALLLAFYAYFNWPDASCSDGKLNQDEEKIDCGGVCTPCINDPKDLVILWTRVFGVGGEFYEAASLVENPNLSYGVSDVRYSFKFYDSKNVLISAKENRTFFNPHDRFVLLSSVLDMGNRVPVRASLEIEYLAPWRYLEESKLSLVVSEKKFLNEPFPSLEARLFNQSPFSVSEIYTATVLYDELGNAVAASSGFFEKIEGEAEQKIIFTWPSPFLKQPFSSEIFTRINLLKNISLR